MNQDPVLIVVELALVIVFFVSAWNIGQIKKSLAEIQKHLTKKQPIDPGEQSEISS